MVLLLRASDLADRQDALFKALEVSVPADPRRECGMGNSHQREERGDVRHLHVPLGCQDFPGRSPGMVFHETPPMTV